jgi:PKD domain
MGVISQPRTGSAVRSRGATSLATVVGLCSLVLALSLGATPAGAVIAKIGGRAYGVTPIRGVNAARLPAVKRALGALKLSATAPVPYDTAGQLVNHGGPVMHSVTTHVIYWDPGGEFTAATKSIVHKFFTDVAHDSGSATNVFGVGGQYTDTSGNATYSSTFASEKVDKDPYPSTGSCTTPKGVSADPGPFFYSKCLFDEQLQSELATYIEKEALPRGPAQLYFLLLPHKVVSCFEEEDPEIGEEACSNNVFCAYHSSIEGGTANEIIYADIPFSLLDSGDAKGCQSDGNAEIQHPNGDTNGTDESTRYADVALKYTSHEYIEAATDPLGNAWFDGTGQEIGDKCNFTGSGSEPGEDPNAFLPTLGGSASSGTLFNQAINTGSYYLQSEWDNAGKVCLMKPLALSAAEFTPTSASTVVGSAVNFKGSATDPYGELGFAWTFGDGGTGTGSSPSHTYAAPGSYTVRMTPKDALTGSTVTPVEHTVTVSKSPQTIMFTSAAPGSATVGGPTYTVTATASSGLPVSFSSATPSVCSLSGSTVSFLAAGMCTIHANQAGNSNYDAAPQTQQSFAVGKGSQTITFTSTAPSATTVGGTPYTVTATASSGLPVSFTIDAASSSVCSISGATVSFVGPGMCTIDANQAGNSNYDAAPQTQQSFAVASEPLVTSLPISRLPSELTSGSGQIAIVMTTPNSNFSVGDAKVNPTTGAITFTVSVSDPGAFSWVLTFQNGKFGIFASAASTKPKCKAGFIRLKGKCRPAMVLYTKGEQSFAAARAVKFTIKPSASAKKALENALNKHTGLSVSALLTFQSSSGGSPVSHTRPIVVKLSKTGKQGNG